MLEDGTRWAWGLNSEGELGDGTTQFRLSPVAVGGELPKAVDLIAGRVHSFALLGDISLFAWGANNGGMLGDGSFLDKLSPVKVIGFAGRQFAQQLRTRDFNADGRADILWRHAVTGENYIYFMQGTTIIQEGNPRTVANLSWTIAGRGDFDGDGRTDILWRNTATGENYVYLMDGLTIKPTEGYIRTVTDQNWQVAGIGDFDGDGKDDILWRNSTTGENYIYPMEGLTVKPSEGFIRTVTSQDWQVAGVGDFDGDGNADVLWRNSSTGENYIYPMDGLTIKPSEGFTRTVTEAAWQIKGVGDFDGDGMSDILWRNNATGENYLYPMSGTTIKPTEGFVRTVADLNWRIVAVGDFDGDGNSDILWRHFTTGDDYIYPMQGTAIKSTEGFIRAVTDQNWVVVSK